MKPVKVLIIQEWLPHYRLPFFNELARSADMTVTVAHTESVKTASFPLLFNQLVIHKKGWRNFFWTTESMHKICRDFDVVVCMFNIRWLNLMALAYRRRSYRLIYWGIAVTSDSGYDTNKRFDFIRYWVARRADALLFYSAYPVSKYQQHGIAAEKMFVANNTIETLVEFLYDEPDQKNSFLFLGTLYKEKRVEELIEAYALSRHLYQRPVVLNIVGQGESRQFLEEYAKQRGVADGVIFHGAINSPVDLKPFFRAAFACVSPGQAGLSVLQSMALGIPFVTSESSITGGERFNIKHLVNGLLYEGGAQPLAGLLVKMVNEPSWTQTLGKAAFEHFKEHCTLEKMACSFKNAIDFATKAG